VGRDSAPDAYGSSLAAADRNCGVFGLTHREIETILFFGMDSMFAFFY
jgi:hypothetical protein